MGLVADEVAGLAGRGAVVAQAVGLDHEAQIRPMEGDLEVIDPLLAERLRQTSREGQGTEARRRGEAEGGAIEQRAEWLDTGLARTRARVGVFWLP
jgi:hypothetical protein